ncbi:MAG: hypothetical protein NC548_10675 [Lachnospiraceae bacterium]|nr:hypothetical protein [Lachnospiraceae bacterium]
MAGSNPACCIYFTLSHTGLYVERIFDIMTLDDYLDEQLLSVYTRYIGYADFLEYGKSTEHVNHFKYIFGDEVKKKLYFKSGLSPQTTKFDLPMLTMPRIVDIIQDNCFSDTDSRNVPCCVMTEDICQAILRRGVLSDGNLLPISILNEYANCVYIRVKIVTDGGETYTIVPIPLVCALHRTCSEFLLRYLEECGFILSSSETLDYMSNSRVIQGFTIDATNNLYGYNPSNHLAYRQPSILGIARRIVRGIPDEYYRDFIFTDRVVVTSANMTSCDTQWLTLSPEVIGEWRRIIYEQMFIKESWNYAQDRLYEVLCNHSTKLGDLLKQSIYDWFTMSNCIHNLDLYMKSIGCEDGCYRLIGTCDGKELAKKYLHV